MRPVIMLLVLTVTTPAFAGEPHSKGRIVRPEFTAGDWAGSIFAGLGVGALGGLLGGSLGYGIGEACEYPLSACRGWSTGVSAGAGFLFGGSAGVYFYGQSQGHRGSYWAAAGGWALGSAAATGLVMVAVEDASSGNAAIAVMSVVLLPALGGTAGYVLSLDKGTPGPMPVGGLVELHDGVPSLGVPNVDVALDQAGAFERIDVRLVGGRF